MELGKTICWSLCVAVSIAAISYSMAIYNIEEVKQTSFMMQACAKAGGTWNVGFAGRPTCTAPKPQS